MLKINSEENFNELVFENKNKSYGAYAMRKSYHGNVTISLAVTSAFFLLSAWLCISFTNKNIIIPVTIGENVPVYIPDIKEIYIPMPEKKKVEKVDVIENAPKTESGQMKASDDSKDVLNKTTDDLVISKNANPKGDSAATKGPGVIAAPAPLAPSAPAAAGTYAEVMPKMDNMSQFITNNLEFPRQALANGTNGTVYINFVVEVDGSITNIKLLKGIGDGCEEEAMRVVGLMPKWEPGTIKNVPVRIQCNLPIKFRIK